MLFRCLRKWWVRNEPTFTWKIVLFDKLEIEKVDDDYGRPSFPQSDKHSYEFQLLARYLKDVKLVTQSSSKDLR